jgi:hypothetical protein
MQCEVASFAAQFWPDAGLCRTGSEVMTLVEMATDQAFSIERRQEGHRVAMHW